MHSQGPRETRRPHVAGRGVVALVKGNQTLKIKWRIDLSSPGCLRWDAMAGVRYAGSISAAACWPSRRRRSLGLVHRLLKGLPRTKPRGSGPRRAGLPSAIALLQVGENFGIFVQGPCARGRWRSESPRPRGPVAPEFSSRLRHALADDGFFALQIVKGATAARRCAPATIPRL